MKFCVYIVAIVLLLLKCNSCVLFNCVEGTEWIQRDRTVLSDITTTMDALFINTRCKQYNITNHCS